MTRTAHARIAGFTFLFYLAAGLSSLFLFSRTTGGETVAAKLAAVSQHATEAGFVVMLGLCQSFSAQVLAVTLWAIAHAQEPGLAMLDLACRAAGSAGCS